MMNLDGKETEEAHWRQVIDELHERLAEAEETLRAIADYRVDAFVMGHPDEKRVYTLNNADYVYRVILEAINEGAATLASDGTILYCNPAFANLLQVPVSELSGSLLANYVLPDNRSRFHTLFEQGLAERSRGEVYFVTSSNAFVPVLLSCSTLQLDSARYVCLVATNLSEQKRQAQLVEERTTQLVEINQRLQQEMEERQQAEQALTEVRRRLSHIREMERLLLARELHDGPLQEVIAMAFDLLLLAQTLKAEEQVAKVTAIGNSVQKTARQLRLMAQTLRPPLLAHLGLSAAMRAHVKQVQEVRESPTVQFASSENFWNVPEEMSLAILRVMQQAVQNALQHASANHIDVRLHYTDDALCLEVEDDGIGFSKPYNRAELAREGHLGVVGMAERVEAIRGQFDVVSEPGKGTLVRVIVPRPTEEEMAVKSE
jgi:PAS domain S-box-containing protein